MPHSKSVVGRPLRHLSRRRVQDVQSALHRIKGVLGEPFANANWTPEHAWAVHEILDDLLARIEAHYGVTVQDWRCAEDADDDPFVATQLDLFENDFDDPLPF